MNALELKKLAEQTGKSVSISILDLPTEKQQELANKMSLDLDTWQKKMRERPLNTGEVEILHFATKEEAEKAGYVVPRWYDEPVAFKVS